MIRVGIIGLGRNGLEHLRAHVALGKSAVVALCDRNHARLAEAGQIVESAACYTDLEDFVRHPGLQAVGINTGEGLHTEPFLRAIAAGLHILIEKPLANSPEDIRTMARAVAAHPRVKVQAGYILRFNPVFARIHELAREGRLGDLYYLESDYIHNLLYQAQGSDAVTGANWYLDERLPMVSAGSHALDLLRWISGKEVVSVWAYANHIAYPAMRHDDCQVALFRFTDGSIIGKVAALFAPRCPRAPYYNLRAYGTLGTIERDTIALVTDPGDLHPAFIPVDSERIVGHEYAPEIADWLDAIHDDRPPCCTFADGANSTLSSLYAVRASIERQELAVPDVRTWMEEQEAGEPH